MLLRQAATYRVVAFIVNVKLVENNVKSRVGRVMVMKVTAQKRMLGMARRRAKAKPIL